MMAYNSTSCRLTDNEVSLCDSAQLNSDTTSLDCSDPEIILSVNASRFAVSQNINQGN